MTKKRLRGFLSKLQREYLDFLQYEDRQGIQHDNKKDWNAKRKRKTPYRQLDHQIRWKVRLALDDLRLVFEKVSFLELKSFIDDPEFMKNLKFVHEKVKSVKTKLIEMKLEKLKPMHNTTVRLD